jgi:large subunit ribosomal protein L43
VVGREYLKTRVVPLARAFPQIEMLVTPRPARHPCIRAFYLNGKCKVISVRNKTPQAIEESCKLLRETDGSKVKNMRKMTVLSKTPSVRGMWSPFNTPPVKI